MAWCVCMCACMWCVCVFTWSSHSQEENEDMESELRDTAEKLRKAMEQSARQQSEYMTAKDQLNSLEKAKVRVHQSVYMSIYLYTFASP